MSIEQLQYPIGKFEKPEVITATHLAQWIDTLAAFPVRLKLEVAHLSDTQLDTPYRPQGWWVRQVVHHCADSHLNSFVRFKLALTENEPTVKPYFEERWAELPDSKTMAVQPSLLLLEGLHARWVVLLKSLTAEQLQRKFLHPEHSRPLQLNEYVGFYAWHCAHHLAHITQLKKRENWQ